MSLASRGLVGAVRYYQRVLSPRKPVPTCRFTPTCSEYAAQAIERHGAVKGGWLAAWRVARCNPLLPGGYDPVPEQFPGRPGVELSSTSPPSFQPQAPSLKSPSPKKRRVS
ncbi:membrane protein insertion efficiency factor YidD [Deinococcus frigens]|uniref:membrane protein insertion efficiency factor YidD n=1 Tax=Deinococcus frigens TaxID=249403 RepID=UPI0004963764|nr:membrane protein insertion efficiency factor YidD [Deinococcus frigens]